MLTLNQWQIAEWDAYFELHPFGDDMNHFMLAKFMAMAFGKSPRHYMPQFRGEQEDPDFAEANAYLQELIRRGDS